MAKELDDYENELTADDAEAIIEVAELVPIQSSSPSHTQRSSTAMSPTFLTMALPTTTPIAPFGSDFVFPPPHLKEKGDEAEDIPDTVSIRSSRSTRSVKSIRTRGGELSRTSSVRAAKTRSHRASQSSLRLTTGHSRKQSSIRLRSPQYEEQPPIPELPLHFADSVMPVSTPYASSTLLRLDSRSPSLRRQGSLDTVCTSRSPSTSAAALAFRGRSADDIYVRPHNPSSETQFGFQVYNLTIPKYETSIFETSTICDFPLEEDGLCYAI